MDILIVENEESVARALIFLLATSEHQARRANDLGSAMRSLDDALPDVALVDIGLANGSSGIDVALELKKRGVPCIFMSADMPKGVGWDLAVGCLHKPFDAESLFAALERARNPGSPLARAAGLLGCFEPYGEPAGAGPGRPKRSVPNRDGKAPRTGRPPRKPSS